MPPAFSSPRQTAAFALLLAVLLALPALVAEAGWFHRRDVYPAIPLNYAPSPWIQQKIFDETGDVDMVFLGSSHIWHGIDTPYVQRRLTGRLGREATVFTLGWPWPGFDALYIIGRDLLDRRHVHTLVIYDDGGVDTPHLYSSRWFRAGEDSDALAGLSWLAKSRLYSGAVLSMPRQLLSLIRPNLAEDPLRTPPNFWTTYYRAPNLAEHLGSVRARLAYGVSPDFIPFQPHGDAKPADVVVYSAQTRDQFEFSSGPAHPYQLHFLRKLAQLCEERGTQLVVLKMPFLNEKGARIPIAPPEMKPGMLGAPVEMVGIPPEKLFAGIAAGDVPKFFYDGSHLNENGQDLFTPLITPALIKLYDSANH